MKQVVKEELEKAGFEVDLCPNFHALEVENGVSPMNFVKMLGHSSREEFIKTHDWALIVVNVKGYAQENDVRVRWSCNPQVWNCRGIMKKSPLWPSASTIPTI